MCNDSIRSFHQRLKNQSIHIDRESIHNRALIPYGMLTGTYYMLLYMHIPTINFWIGGEWR